MDEARRTTHASAARLWAVVSDVASWPRYTPSMTSVEPQDGVPLRNGARFRITQPRLKPAVWTVTDYADGRGFVWQSKAPGLVTTAAHWIDPDINSNYDSGGTRLTLSVEQRGLLARPLGLFYGRLIRRYLQQEADGLIRAAEGTTAS